MPATDDIAYFDRRARQERDLARKAEGTDIRHVHLDFAAHYEARIEQVRSETINPRGSGSA